MAAVNRTARPGELLLLTALGAALFFGGWQALAASDLVSKQVLPSPLAVLEAGWTMTQKPFAGNLLQAHILASLQRFAMGFGLAALIGVPLGLVMGRYRVIDDAVSPIFEGLRFIAPLAWVPFAALWFGTGIGGPVMVIFAGAFPPCVINAYRGAQLVETRLVEAAQTLGARNVRIIAEVLLPGALPSIVAGLRVSAGLAWQSLIGAELIVVSAGIGYVMVQGQSNLSPAIVMAGMLAVGAVGLAIDVLLRLAERTVRKRWGHVA
ncbi:MAG TPA: ABC transporter permease [Alphaproteobacteria bacterium]|nr:ABC transporter permease [Alphaproteobacteria bacterium]